MQLGRVVGTATATVKHPSMAGRKLLVVQLLDMGAAPDGEPILAVDSVGAGRGEVVLVTSDGAAAQQLLHDDRTPVRYTVMGIRDA